MRVFVTGATGFIGIPVVKDLIGAGHQVLGLARSEAGAATLASLGAGIQRGELEDTDSLRAGAVAADAVIHLAFIHDFTKFAACCAADKRAIETMGAAIAGTGKRLLVTGGLAGLPAAPGQLADESAIIPANYPFPRVSEQTALGLRDVEAAVVRLSQIHDTTKQGLVTYLIALARTTGVSAYIGNGQTRWSAAHVSDTARLYRLALEKFQTGARYHAVAETGITVKDIAETIGRKLNVPVKSIDADAAADHFGGLAHLVSHDLAASSALTQERLGWTPSGPGLLADLNRMTYA